jgi:hypothetical protein
LFAHLNRQIDGTIQHATITTSFKAALINLHDKHTFLNLVSNQGHLPSRQLHLWVPQGAQSLKCELKCRIANDRLQHLTRLLLFMQIGLRLLRAHASEDAFTLAMLEYFRAEKVLSQAPPLKVFGL